MPNITSEPNERVASHADDRLDARLDHRLDDAPPISSPRRPCIVDERRPDLAGVDQAPDAPRRRRSCARCAPEPALSATGIAELLGGLDRRVRASRPHRASTTGTPKHRQQPRSPVGLEPLALGVLSRAGRRPALVPRSSSTSRERRARRPTGRGRHSAWSAACASAAAARLGKRERRDGAGSSARDACRSIERAAASEEAATTGFAPAPVAGGTTIAARRPRAASRAAARRSRARRRSRDRRAPSAARARRSRAVADATRSTGIADAGVGATRTLRKLGLRRRRRAPAPRGRPPRTRRRRGSPGPPPLLTIATRRPGRERLVREHLAAVEQLLERVDADHARLAEQRVDGDVGAGQRGRVRRGAACPGLRAAALHRDDRLLPRDAPGEPRRTSAGSRTTRGTGGSRRCRGPPPSTGAGRCR